MAHAQSSRLGFIAVFLTLALAGGALHAAQDSAQGPRDYPGECPGSGGCVFGKWTVTAPVSVYRERSTASGVAFELKAGAGVTGVSSLFLVTKPGRCTVRAGALANEMTPPMKPVSLPEGSVIHFYRFAEGEVFTEIKRKSVSVCCLSTDPPQLECEMPEDELWLLVRNADGVAGWTNERAKFKGTSQHD